MNPFSKYTFPFPFGHSVSKKWITNDTEKNFIEHLKKYPTSTHLNKYKKNPIEYKLNNYGFRTHDNFTEGDFGTVYLGCSHTFGIGHYLENTWSYKLHKSVGEGKFFNLSMGSTGLVSQYYFLKYFSDKLKFKRVYHFYPTECNYRYGFMDEKGKMRIIGPFAENWRTEIEENLWKEYLINESYNKLHNSVYKDAIKNICKEMECEYISYEKSYHTTTDPYHKNMTPARDLLHYYVENQNKIYKKFLKLSNKKISII